MARITVEDCLKTGVYDKFDLVLIASQRTKQLNAGARTEVEKDVKNTLRSLIEIEENKVSVDEIREAVIHSYQKYGKNDDSENDNENDSIVEDVYNSSSSSTDNTESTEEIDNDNFDEYADDDLDDADEQDSELDDLDFDDDK